MMFRGLIVCVIAIVSGFCGEPTPAEEGWHPKISLPPGRWEKSTSTKLKKPCDKFFSEFPYTKIEENGEASAFVGFLFFKEGDPLFEKHKTFLTSLPKDPREAPLGIADKAFFPMVNEAGHHIFFQFFRYQDNYTAMVFCTKETSDPQSMYATAKETLSKCKYDGLVKQGHLDVEGQVIPGKFMRLFSRKIGIFVPSKWKAATHPDKTMEFLFCEEKNMEIFLWVDPDSPLDLEAFPKEAEIVAKKLGMKVEKKVNLSIKNAKGSGFRLRGMHPNEDKHALIGYCTKDERKILETIFYKGEKDPLIEAVMDTLEFLD